MGGIPADSRAAIGDEVKDMNVIPSVALIQGI